MRGQTENILKGRCNGGRGTFGYTLDSERKFHINPLTSPFVLESFKKYNEGSTMKEIRDGLNENGIKNPVGGAFTYNSVEHMLKNRRYMVQIWIALLHQEKPVRIVCWFFFFGAEEDLNSNDDDRSQRLKQGGVVGAAF